MKVFSVLGISQSGKTTTIEEIIKELKRRRYTIGTVKDIHFEGFSIDTKGTNTYRHAKAGADLVTARALYETDILFNQRLDIYDILRFYNYDYVILEGCYDANVPKILTGHNVSEINERLDNHVFAISGRIAAQVDTYKGLPVINALENIQTLVDLIEEKVFDILPDFDAKCCGACGFSCRELHARILKGIASRSDCNICTNNIKLFVGAQEVNMVPFVQKILANAVEGVVKELEGFKSNADIRIEIKKG